MPLEAAGTGPGNPGDGPAKGAARVRVRKAEARDRQNLVNIIENTSNLTLEEKDCAAELLDIYLNNPSQNDYFFIVATEGSDKPSGYVCYGKNSLTDAVYDLYWILVDEGCRRSGIGRALLYRTEAVLREEGARLLVAETSGLPAYEPARRFYIKNGFREEARVREFYKPGDDLVIYVKRLREHTI